MEVYTLTNRRLVLTEPALSSGGEGAVYEIDGYPNKVVKIYHDPADARARESKIREMVRISQSDDFQQSGIAENAAWPLAPLFNKQGDFVGFSMNRVHAGTELDDIYAYPPISSVQVAIDDRIRSLISLCEAIDRLHRLGHVFGDFNPNNIKIRADGSVNLVDMDSCQIRSADREYRCTVCAPGYAAPEVVRACAGSTYADCPSGTFTQASDNFALAVHVFRMLMNGCHPYSCEQQLPADGSVPAAKMLDRRVEAGETPFFKRLPGRTTPRYAPRLSDFPRYIRKLFRRAFVNGHANPAARPTPAEWKAALERYGSGLVTCSAHSAHSYWRGASTCPYCAADARFRNKPVPAQQPIRRRTFSFTSFVACTIMQLYLTTQVMPWAYETLFESPFLRALGLLCGAVAGVIGALLYPGVLSPRRHLASRAWWEYPLVLLASAGLSFAFCLGMYSVKCMVEIPQLLPISICSGVIYAIISD